MQREEDLTNYGLLMTLKQEDEGTIGDLEYQLTKAKEECRDLQNQIDGLEM